MPLTKGILLEKLDIQEINGGKFSHHDYCDKYHIIVEMCSKC